MVPWVPMVMPDGSVVTGKTSTRLGAASSLIMNALKHVSGVDLELEVISDEAIEPSASSRRISWAAKPAPPHRRDAYGAVDHLGHE